jgi:hypothetical protein
MIASIIESVYGFLSEADLNLLDNLCINFNTDNTSNGTPEKGNFYYRMIIDKETHFIDYQNTIKDYIHKKYKVDVKISAIWINKVTTETNKDDKFHTDECNFTVVSYINDNFKGGEFTFQKNAVPPTEKIKPKRNLVKILQKMRLNNLKVVIKPLGFSLLIHQHKKK